MLQVMLHMLFKLNLLAATLFKDENFIARIAFRRIKQSGKKP